MNFQHIYDMIIIGGGPGGYTAALYAARAGLDTVVLEKLSVGGQMALTEQIDNYPGFEDGIDGFELAEKCSVRPSVLAQERNTPKFTNWTSRHSLKSQKPVRESFTEKL